MAARMVRKALDVTLGAAKSAQSVGATSWKYIKVEMVPPLTVNFFNGPSGKKMEKFAGRVTNGFIKAIAGRIKEMDAEAQREKLEILAAIKAHEKKVKAEKKAKELQRMKDMAKEAAEAIKKASALAEKKKAEMAAKQRKEDPKPTAKVKKEPAKPKKKSPKKKSPKKKSPRKKPPKKTK